MKKIIFVGLVLLGFTSTSFAQSKTPIAVTTAFNQKFPNATNVKWDKENAHEYEASFEWKAEKHSANFTDKGEWLETESPLTFSQLPNKVQTAYKTLYKETAIKAVAKIETSKGDTKYEIELKKGLKTMELFYKNDGTVIKE
ncbi:MAG: PepSY-like domain-containing protein [Flavobacteriaceae bacterium]|nr:PepSY-like domain-containing protein [Flavobacteriaceae bacterium]